MNFHYYHVVLLMLNYQKVCHTLSNFYKEIGNEAFCEKVEKLWHFLRTFFFLKTICLFVGNHHPQKFSQTHSLFHFTVQSILFQTDSEICWK